MKDSILRYQLLIAVDASDGELTQSSIAWDIGRSVQSDDFALRPMVVKGWIKVSGGNRRNLRYSFTPSGILEKTLPAYDFLRIQSALYWEVRRRIWVALSTETTILYLILDGLEVQAIYVDKIGEIEEWNRIPIRFMSEFQDDCETPVLLEPFPEELLVKIAVKSPVGYHEDR